jgi:PAS domain S-box-containing protein
MHVRKIRTMPRLPRYWAIAAAFVAMVILQACVAAFSIQLLSTMRAYVAGESLYSKARKDAQLYLLAYAQNPSEADYAAFMSAMKVPLADRAARKALQLEPPDLAAARQGFLDGGSDRDDIDGLIRIFRWFQHAPLMARPIATWTAGDETIEEMHDLVAQAHASLLAGAAPSSAMAAMREQTPILNARLNHLTRTFSDQLGEASRTTQRLLLVLNACIAALLSLSGFVFVRRSMRLQAAADQRMDRLIHAVTDGVVTIDGHRRIVLFNRAAEAMFGVASSQALGSPIDRFIGGLGAADDRAGPPDTGSIQALEGRRHDGRIFPIEASVARLQMERDVLTTIVLRDVTARMQADAERRAHEALEASSRAKTEFLSRMSHELRTPLNAVIGFSRLLRVDSERPLSRQQLARVRHVENAGAHLLALVNDVLDLSRIECGEMPVAREAVQLVKVIEEAVTMVSPLVARAGVEVFVGSGLPAPGSAHVAPAWRVPADDLWVSADPVRLRQVLVNLLTNAVKYNRPDGRVALTWTCSEHDCEIRIDDTGKGIPADQLPSLFQPFNRLGAESSGIEGTGIGLALSRQLAEMMDGSLTIASTVGVGTCARLLLKISSAPAGGPDPARVDALVGATGAGLSVLYAEDDEVNAELVRQIVSLRRGVSLRVASDGAAALESARADPPDLMLVDMNLGDMTGIELARALRRDRSLQDVCLVALSADALPEQIDAAMACGFERYLTKPLDFDALLALLDSHRRPLAPAPQAASARHAPASTGAA